MAKQTSKNTSWSQDPFQVFHEWYQAAEQTDIRQPDAMTLATATASGVPSARIVLYKGCNPEGLRFFTNYRSRKARELEANPRAAAVFYWPPLDRQVRVTGRIKRLSEKESDEYWNTRPRESQIGALASPQSSSIPSRAFLEGEVRKLDKTYRGRVVPRPKHWGGYCLIPNGFEFWMLGEFRLHERIAYTKKGKIWTRKRLAP